MPPIVAERPANGGLLQFGVLSLYSRFTGMKVELRKSLWLTPRIFPFSRDCGRRPGSIGTAWCEAHLWKASPEPVFIHRARISQSRAGFLPVRQQTIARRSPDLGANDQSLPFD
jgi:hypothetical protein